MLEIFLPDPKGNKIRKFSEEEEERFIDKISKGMLGRKRWNSKLCKEKYNKFLSLAVDNQRHLGILISSLILYSLDQ